MNDAAPATGPIARLGLNLPAIDMLGVEVGAVFGELVRVTKVAEAAGFEVVLASDHNVAPPTLGDRAAPMLECVALMAGLAATTSTISVGSMVAANGLRNPAMLARSLSTIAMIAPGRVQLGLGAGWFPPDFRSVGIEFGSPADRLGRLREALDIVRPLLRGEETTVDGEWFSTDRALNVIGGAAPPPPIVLGGVGDRLLDLAALSADGVDVNAEIAHLPERLAALRMACDRHDRDPATLVTTAPVLVVWADTTSAAEAVVERRFEGLPGLAERTLWGDDRELAEKVASRVLDAGVDGVGVVIANEPPIPDEAILAIGSILDGVLDSRSPR